MTAWAAPLEVDPSFDFGTGPTGSVNALALQPDGRLIVAGSFTNFSGQPCSGIVRLLRSGALDPDFHLGPAPKPGSFRTVNTVVLDSAGRILVGGDFNVLQGFTRTALIRLLPDGRPDPSLQQPLLAADSYRSYGPLINSILIQPDERIVIAGVFYQRGAPPPLRLNSIMRLQSDGVTDPSFAVEGGFTFGISEIRSLALTPDGTLAFGGRFETFASQSYPWTLTNMLLTASGGFIRTEGGLQPRAFGQPEDYIIASALAVGSDGRVIAAGKAVSSWPFPDYGPQTARLGHYRPDATWEPLPGFSGNGAINALLLDPAAGMVIGGQFSAINNRVRGGLARLTPEGRLDESFHAPLIRDLAVTNAPGIVRALALLDDGSLVAAGAFTHVGTVRQPSLTRLRPQAPRPPGPVAFSTPEFVGREEEGMVNLVLERQDDVNDRTTVRLRTAGGSATPDLDYIPLDRTVDFAPGQRVAVVPVQIRQDALVEGEESIEVSLESLLAPPNTPAATAVIRIRDAISPPPQYSLKTSYAAGDTLLSLLPNGQMYMARYNAPDPFHPIDTVISRWQPDGSIDTGFLPVKFTGGSASAASLVVRPDGRLLVLGDFTKVNGLAYPGVVSLQSNGAIDSGLRPYKVGQSTVGSRGYPSRGVRLADGTFLLGGALTVLAPGTPLQSLVRMDDTGSVLTNFPGLPQPAPRISGIVPTGDGGAIVTSYFQRSPFDSYTYDYQIHRFRPDGLLDTRFAPAIPNLRLTGPVGVQPDQRILVVAWDTRESASSSPLVVVRLNPDGTPDTTFGRLTGFQMENSPNISPGIGGFGTLPDGRFVIYGLFNRYQGTPRNSVAAFRPDGTPDPTWNWSPTLRKGYAFSSVGWGGFGFDAAGDLHVQYSQYTQRNQFGAQQVTNFFERLSSGPGSSRPLIQVALRSTSAEEADGRLVFDIVRPESTEGPARVRIWTRGITATPGQDFRMLDQVFEFAPGESRKTAAIEILDDSLVEGDETFALVAEVPQGSYLSGPAEQVIRIFDDDWGLECFYPDYEIAENSGPLTVGYHVVGTNYPAYVAVEFETNPGTALPNLDYKPVRTDLKIFPKFPAYFDIEAQPDDEVEPDEFFTLKVRALTPGAGITAQPSTKITIHDANREGRPAIGADGPVFGLVRHGPDGILVCGDFLRLNGAIRPTIARLHADGRLDSTFAPPFASGDSVHVIAAQSDGHILVAKRYRTGFLEGRDELYRLKPDGRLDPSFPPVTFLGWNGDNADVIRVILPLDDGTTLVGGSITNVNGTPTSALVRLQADGGVDASFPANLTVSDGPSVVQALAIDTQRRILVGGTFLQFNGAGRNGIARLMADGSPDDSFRPELRGPNLIPPVARGATPATTAVRLDWLEGYNNFKFITTDREDRVITGRQFNYNVPLSGFNPDYRAVDRILADGTKDSTFDTSLSGLASGLFHQVLPDGSLLTGDGSKLRRLLTNGVADPSFRSPKLVSPRLDRAELNPTGQNQYYWLNFGQINCALAMPDGSVWLGGRFFQADQHTALNLALLPKENFQGGPPGLLPPQFSPHQKIIALLPDFELTPYVSYNIEVSEDLRSWTTKYNLESSVPAVFATPEGRTQFYRIRKSKP